MADFYRDGYEAGQAWASIARKAIKDAGKAGLPALCGRTIESRKSMPEASWEVRHSQSWSIGFFAGYLDRAEIILESGR